MNVCWKYEADNRPSFKTISYFFKNLKDLTMNSEKCHDFSIIKHFTDILPYELTVNTETIIKI